MIIENKAKGWYGSLSKEGRDAAILAFLKLSGYKNSMQKKNQKKIQKKDSDKLALLKDNLVVVKNYKNSVKTIINKPKKKPKTETKDNKEEKLQFHKLFHQKTEEDESKYINNPSCTKYTPKYNLVYPKLLTGPKWEVMSGRKYKKIEIDEKDFLITHESKIDSGYKYLVNMNKTTKRGDIFGNKDVRFRSDKRFDRILSSIKNKNKKNKNKKKKKIYRKKSKIKNISNLSKENNRDKTGVKDFLTENNNLQTFTNDIINKIQKEIKKENSLNFNESKINTEKYKSLNINTSINQINNRKSKIYLLKKKKSSTKIFKNQEEENNSSSLNKNKNEIENHAINFEKIISREKLNKIHSKDKYLDIARIINYSLVEERPKTFTFFKSTKNSNFIKKFEGIESSINFDINKADDILTIHKLGKVPNFNLILSRPSKKKNPLPSFMQRIVNRDCPLTEKTLELNGYSQGKLPKAESSFFPKQSFNNIVNIQIMAGKAFEDNNNIDDINNKKDAIKTKIKFKYKSLGKLIKEGALTKFDNITYKTIHKTKNYLNSDLSKYLVGINE